MADLAELIYRLMAERVRVSHMAATDDTILPMLAKGKLINLPSLRTSELPEWSPDQWQRRQTPPPSDRLPR